MRNHLLRPTALASVAALALALAACSGSGSGSEGSGSGSEGSDAGATGTTDDPAALCAAVAQLDELSSGLGGIDPANPDEAIANLEEITSTLEGVDAPAEVAEAVEVVSTNIRDLTDGLSSALADPTAEDAMTALNDAMSSVSDQEFIDATTELNEYTQANC